MKYLIAEAVKTIISIILSGFLLLAISNTNDSSIDLKSITYVLSIETGQMFFPFLIYVILCDFLVKKFTMKRPGFKKMMLIHFSTYIALMLVITVFMSLGDTLLAGHKRGISHYIQEFGIFIAFCPIACIVTCFFNPSFRNSRWGNR